jgi:hypothetical protein
MIMIKGFKTGEIVVQLGASLPSSRRGRALALAMIALVVAVGNEI